MTAVRRRTGETDVSIRIAPPETGEGDGPSGIQTGDGFLDHMLTALARYGGLRLSVRATGDLRHHLVEDVAITLGEALSRATPEACRRYAHAVVPMDDALVEVALDAGGRPYYEGRLPSRLYEHFFRSLALTADFTLHVRVVRGRDRHHVVEAAFKALGLCLREAMKETGAVFSTKGSVRLEFDPVTGEDA